MTVEMLMLESSMSNSYNNPFSLAKLTYTNSTGMVTYRSKMTHDKNKKNFAISTAEELIAAITQHIPERRRTAWPNKIMVVTAARCFDQHLLKASHDH